MFGLTGTFIVPGLLYLETLGLKRDMFVQALGMTFITISSTLAMSMTTVGLVTWQHAILSAIGLIPVGLGIWLGWRIRHRISEERYRKAFFIVLFITGAVHGRAGLARKRLREERMTTVAIAGPGRHRDACRPGAGRGRHPGDAADCGVRAKDRDRARRRAAGFCVPARGRGAGGPGGAHADIVVEGAPKAVFEPLARSVVEAGRIFMPLSVGRAPGSHGPGRPGGRDRAPGSSCRPAR